MAKPHRPNLLHLPTAVLTQICKLCPAFTTSNLRLTCRDLRTAASPTHLLLRSTRPNPHLDLAEWLRYLVVERDWTHITTAVIPQLIDGVEWAKKDGDLWAQAFFHLANITAAEGAWHQEVMEAMCMHCTQLLHLCMDNCNGARSLHPLATLVNLQHLSLHHVSGTALSNGVHALGRLTTLQSLVLTGTCLFEDVGRSLKQLSCLTRLGLELLSADMPLQQPCVFQLPALRSLTFHVQHGPVAHQVKNMADAFRGCTNLTHLDTLAYRLPGLRALTYWPQLASLHLQDLQVLPDMLAELVHCACLTMLKVAGIEAPNNSQQTALSLQVLLPNLRCLEMACADNKSHPVHLSSLAPRLQQLTIRPAADDGINGGSYLGYEYLGHGCVAAVAGHPTLSHVNLCLPAHKIGFTVWEVLQGLPALTKIHITTDGAPWPLAGPLPHVTELVLCQSAHPGRGNKHTLGTLLDSLLLLLPNMPSLVNLRMPLWLPPLHMYTFDKAGAAARARSVYKKLGAMTWLRTLELCLVDCAHWASLSSDPAHDWLSLVLFALSPSTSLRHVWLSINDWVGLGPDVLQVAMCSVRRQVRRAGKGTQLPFQVAWK